MQFLYLHVLHIGGIHLNIQNYIVSKFLNLRSDMPNKPKEPYDARKLQQAIDAIQNKGWSINICSKLFGVPRTTLYDHTRGRYHDVCLSRRWRNPTLCDLWRPLSTIWTKLHQITGSFSLPSQDGSIPSCSWTGSRMFQNCTTVRPVILIMDNHVSHLSTSVIDVAEEYNIILCCLPPHSSHILQPLDKG